MALELEVINLDGVPEAIRGEYVKKPDGKFRLNVNGVEDVAGLKSALDRTKSELREYKAAFKDTGLTAADIGKLVDSNKALIETRAALNDARIDHAIAMTLVTAKATQTGLALLPLALKSRISVETTDGKPTFRITGADGAAMAGSGPSGEATFSDLAKELIATYPDLIQGTGAGGGGASGRGSRSNGLPPKTILRSEFDKMDPTTRHTKIVKEGWSVVD
jgi:hypothetical protein